MFQKILSEFKYDVRQPKLYQNIHKIIEKKVITFHWQKGEKGWFLFGRWFF